MVFFTFNVKEIKIAIWDTELVFSTGLKSGGIPGVKGVYCFIKVGSGPR